MDTLLISIFLLVSTTMSATYSKKPVEIVRNHTRVKILESNNVSLRPGSIYDNITVFESLLEFPKPGFNYEFVDSGLGAAEPLYPMYQKGHQGSYFQLFPAFFTDKARHIEHYTSLVTPENCQVDGGYFLRHIDEYPKSQFAKERAEGFNLVVVRLEHYMKLSPDAQCGRHRANDPDPSFDPMKFVKKHKKAMYLTDFPQKDLARYEAKLSVIYHLSEERNKTKWRRFDLDDLQRNSLWYYKDGHDFDYGVSTPIPQTGFLFLNQAKDLIEEASPFIQSQFPLSRVVTTADFQKVVDFLNGKPRAGFDPQDEPGHDTLNLNDVTTQNIYTSGLHMEPIKNVHSDVTDPSHFKLVAITYKPYEEQDDVSWDGLKVIPQVRFVYQLTDSQRPLEQMFLHVKFDVVTRTADKTLRDVQHLTFLRSFDNLLGLKKNSAPGYEYSLKLFLDTYTSTPVESIAFSSSLTGIWIFGTLTRNNNIYRELEPLRIVRNGIDVGYYSSVYDNDLFRDAISKASGERKVVLQRHIDSIIMDSYHDSRRQDPHAISFERVTCAQCHQTSGRDGVHISFNDELDRRIKSPTIPTEFFFHDGEKQLRMGQKYWHP